MDFFEKKMLGKLLDEELLNEELEERYGKGTLLLIGDINKYLVYSMLQKFLIAGLLILAPFIVFEVIDSTVLAEITIYLIFFSITTLGKIRYINESIILTPKEIIIQNIFKKNRIVTYDEINKAVKLKKVEIKNRYIYIPTNKNSIKILILKNMKMEPPLEDIQLLVDMKMEKALAVIQLKSQIVIPEITKKRKKYIGHALKGNAFAILGVIFLLIQVFTPVIMNKNGLSGYIHIMFSKANLMFFVMGIGCLIIGKALYALGQYKLRKDINDPEHIKIKL